MFKGFKHAIKCTKCGEMNFHDVYESAEQQASQLSKCCNAKSEYAGFQPYVDKVLVFAKPIVASPAQANTMNILTIEQTQDVIDVVPQMSAAKKVSIQVPTMEQQESTVLVGRRGKMTTLIMRDSVRDAVEKNDLATVKELAAQYPEEYNDCMRYLPAKIKKCIG